MSRAATLNRLPINGYYNIVYRILVFHVEILIRWTTNSVSIFYSDLLLQSVTE